jgi:alginate O-acetyltransferase complex protein AlgI
MIGWVLFRSASLSAAGTLFIGLLGGYGVVLPTAWDFTAILPAKIVSLIAATGVEFDTLRYFRGTTQVLTLAALMGLCIYVPNSHVWLERVAMQLEASSPPADIRFSRLTATWGVAFGLMMAVAILHISRVSEFMYFQF